MKTFLKWLILCVGVGGTAYVLLLAMGFFAVKYGVTDVEGEIDQHNEVYAATEQEIDSVKPKDDAMIANEAQYLAVLEKEAKFYQANVCKKEIIAGYSPENAALIEQNFKESRSTVLMAKMITAISLAYANKEEMVGQIAQCEGENPTRIAGASSQNMVVGNPFVWQQGDEWKTIETAVARDKEVILRASREANIDPRLLTSSLVVEQLRLFYTQREVYERFFKPLKILGNTTKMAWGVMAIKEKSAIRIEANLKDQNSAYYLGLEYETKLDFQSGDPAKERYLRIADDKDHYYSYLYAALFYKQLMTQWQKAGFDISDRPEILATLYNIGFDKSKPNAEPKVGGSTLEINGQKYTFGGLAYQFYYSGALGEEFPLR